MPDCTILGISDVGAAIVTRSPLDSGVAKLAMKNGIADFLIEREHIMATIPVTDQDPPLTISSHHPHATVPGLVCRWAARARDTSP